MAKKKSHPVEAAAVVVRTPAENVSKALQQIDDTWRQETETISRTYDQAMQGAWHRYIAALKAHQGPSAGTDFDKQFDKERENALAEYHRSGKSADDKMEKARRALLVKTPLLRDENDDSL